MDQITLPDSISPLLCTPALRGTPPPGATVVLIQGQPHLLGGDLVARAAALSVDTIFEGATVALGLHRRDVERLAGAGLSAEWAGRYQPLLRVMMGTHQADRGASFTAATVRWASGGPSAQERARGPLREIALLAPAAGLGDELGFGAADLQSYAGVRDALWEVLSRLTVPAFRQALVTRGVSEARLAELPRLADELFEERQARLFAQGEQVGATGVLSALKAMALGDLTLLSRTAKAQLPAERAERYQLGRLLGTSTRRAALEPEPDPATPPAGTTTGTVAQPTPGAAGAQPATGSTGTTPVTGSTTTRGTTPAPGATAPPHPAQPALPALLPGTVLYTAPAAGGPPVSLVVQPDGTFAWVPAPTPAAPAAPAAPVLAPPAPAPAPAAPARRNRRR